MLKINLNSLVKPKFFWPGIIILLALCVTLYVLKEKEKSSRIATEKELSRIIEAKRVVENNLEEAKKEITERDEQIKLTLDRLEREINARKEAEVRLISTLQEKRVLEEKIEKLTAATKPIEIELEKIVVKATSESAGKVLAVDKEHAFVIVDLGRDGNLNLGDVLSVYRNDEFIGKVEVEKIEERASAAAILPQWQNVEFKENDVVKKL